MSNENNRKSKVIWDAADGKAAPTIKNGKLIFGKRALASVAAGLLTVLGFGFMKKTAAHAVPPTPSFDKSTKLIDDVHSDAPAPPSLADDAPVHSDSPAPNPSLNPSLADDAPVHGDSPAPNPSQA